MFDWRSAREWRQLFRYYQAGILNTLFGFGIYALFVKLGMNIYVAQICAHVLGIAFNFVTYSRYAFAEFHASKRRFILSYIVNYLVGLASLWTAAQFVANPYLAGFFSVVVSSVINYFVLKRLVFAVAKTQ